jgi:uncharacterized membrane protein YfcA
LQIAIITLFAFVSAFVTGVLGFGAGLILTPLLALFLPLKQALAVSALVFLATSGSKVFLFFRYIDWPTYGYGLAFALLGAGAGFCALLFVDPAGFQKVYALLLMVFAVNLLRNREGRELRLPQGIFPSLGGLVSVLANGGGPLFLCLCRRRRLDRVQTVGTMAVTHFSLNIVKVAFFSGAGFVSADYVPLLLPAYAAAILGTRLGRGVLVNRFSERGFSIGVAIFMVLMAVDFLY